MRHATNWTHRSKYLQSTKILNDKHTLLLVTPNRKEHIVNINDVKPCTTLELDENAWNTFLNSIKANCLSHEYNLRE